MNVHFIACDDMTKEPWVWWQILLNVLEWHMKFASRCCVLTGELLVAGLQPELQTTVWHVWRTGPDTRRQMNDCESCCC
jgi:hypothetical protein